ncbi:MAG: nuclear transport factor 2 family protein [Rhodospirillaceae bacterium]|nr:nuclear transport factor 2 family protein [Rhodospirillaceae bacterium]
MPQSYRAPPAADTAVLQAIYAAINRNDIPAAVQYFDPEIVRLEPAGFPTAGTYRGLVEMQTHLSQGRGTWAEGTCAPEQFIAAGDKIVVFLHVYVRLKNRDDWIDARFADGFVLRNGKAVLMQTFATRPEALAWAGLDAADAG